MLEMKYHYYLPIYRELYGFPSTTLDEVAKNSMTKKARTRISGLTILKTPLDLTKKLNCMDFYTNDL